MKRGLEFTPSARTQFISFTGYKPTSFGLSPYGMARKFQKQNKGIQNIPYFLKKT
jgi:hypothetical protein